VLDALKNIPGITVDQDGKVSLRGSDQVAIVIDGRQSSLTPASSTSSASRTTNSDYRATSGSGSASSPATCRPAHRTGELRQ
jgi:hypothetical protein